jgi:hypothetical protein
MSICYTAIAYLFFRRYFRVVVLNELMNAVRFLKEKKNPPVNKND